MFTGLGARDGGPTTSLKQPEQVFSHPHGFKKQTNQNQLNKKAVITIVFFRFNHLLRKKNFFQIQHYRRAPSKSKWIVIHIFEDYREGILLTYVLLNGFYLAEKITYVNSFYNVNKYFHAEIAY